MHLGQQVCVTEGSCLGSHSLRFCEAAKLLKVENLEAEVLGIVKHRADSQGLASWGSNEKSRSLTRVRQKQVTGFGMTMDFRA
jgi:hypothetical protein